jgi:hypothetical protein
MSEPAYTRAFLGKPENGALLVFTASGTLADNWGYIQLRDGGDNIIFDKPSIAREVAQHLLAWAEAHLELE